MSHVVQFPMPFKRQLENRISSLVGTDSALFCHEPNRLIIWLTLPMAHTAKVTLFEDSGTIEFDSLATAPNSKTRYAAPEQSTEFFRDLKRWVRQAPQLGCAFPIIARALS